MSFYASKLIPGKKYPMRNGMQAEYVARYAGILGPDRLLFLMTFADGTRSPFETNLEGLRVHNEGEGEHDIIGSEPYRELVKVVPIKRFVNVYKDGTICAHESLKAANERGTTSRIGVYELPAEIEVTPIQ